MENIEAVCKIIRLISKPSLITHLEEKSVKKTKQKLAD